MRPLTVHGSVLNDEEYDLYDLALVDDSKGEEYDNGYYERMSIGVREVRGWMRGRYAWRAAGEALIL